LTDVKSATKSTPLEKLVANVLETRFENFDRSTVENARARVIDVLGCLIGGANAPGNSELTDLVRDWGGKEEATILVHGGKAPAHNVAMVNSIMARSFDFEPVSPLVDGTSMPGHISGTTVMTAMTMGEAKDISGKELITALLVGDDVASRVLAASGFGFSLGWDCIGTVNTFGATAIAGRLLGLNRLQMRNAFGIALNQLAGSLQNIWDGTTSFKILQGLAARSGIVSAQLAKAGWTGPEDALFSSFGYYHLYTEGCRNPAALTKDLGKNYYSDATFKPYPSCRITHCAIDCALALAGKHGIKAPDIKEATVYVSSAGLNHICGQPFQIGDFPQVNAAFNYQYTVATALLRKSVRPEHFSEKSIRAPQTSALIKKIKLAELPGADLYQARIKVTMKDGREITESTDAPKGDPLRNPMAKDEITAKFWANVDFSQMVTRENAGKLLTLLEKLEHLDSVNRMVPLLAV
jgi:2-methylcitrate dehydratase PrpD